MPMPGVDVVTIKRLGGKFQIACDLSPPELQAIGLVTVQWAHLEHSILVHSLSIARRLGEKVADDAASLSLSRRLAEFRRLGSSPKLPVGDSRRYIKLCDRIANLEAKRHKVVHALWTWDTAEPNRLAALSFRPRVKFTMPVNVERLQKLASQIGELLFDIDFPDGPDFENVVPAPIRHKRRA